MAYTDKPTVPFIATYILPFVVFLVDKRCFCLTKSWLCFCNECVPMNLDDSCHCPLFQRPPSAGEAFSIRLSVHQLCLDMHLFRHFILLYKCHFRTNQRWVHNTEALQVISVRSPSRCWDINGKLKHFVSVSISYMPMPGWFCGSVCGQIIINYDIGYIGIPFPEILRKGIWATCTIWVLIHDNRRKHTYMYYRRMSTVANILQA